MAKQRALICPYCGKMQPETEQCRGCRGFLDPLSRQATHNAMGPWFLKEDGRGFHPGCSYETIVKLIERGDISRHTVLRGPTTRQFWTIAKRVPCVAHLLGYCHACDTSVDPGDHGCHACGVKFGAYLDRNYLGLPEVRPLPWEAEVEDDLSRVGPRIDVPEEMRRELASGTRGRLSSFATDDELTGSGEFTHSATGGTSLNVRSAGSPGGAAGDTSTTQTTSPAAVAAAQPVAHTGHAAQPDVHAQPEPNPSPFDTGIATRSLQRRLRENARTIQRLWIALAASVVANAALLAGLQLGWFEAQTFSEVESPESSTLDRSSSKPTVEQTTPQATSTIRSDAVLTAPSDPGQSQPRDATADNPVDSDAPPAIGADPVGDGVLSPTAAEQAIAAALEQADVLLKSAKDDQRKPEDRVKDYEKVIAILKQLRAEHSIAAAELGIDDRIADYEREAERLRLRVFFP